MLYLFMVLLLHLINRLGLFKRYRPIKGPLVAKAMINVYMEESSSKDVYELDELFTLAG